MELLSGNSKPERALFADSASFRMVLNRNAMTTGLHSNTAAGAADWNLRASTLDETAHDDKPAGMSKDQTR